jgi:hypothetical protein
MTLSNRNLFLTVVMAGKSKIKVPADFVSDEGLHPGMPMTAFLLYLYVAERGSPGVSFSSYKGTNPIMGTVYPYDLT